KPALVTRSDCNRTVLSCELVSVEARLAASCSRFAAALFSARFNAINAPPKPSSRIKIVIAVQTTVLRGTVGTSGGAASISSVDLPQCGQSMLVPTASAGNSRCPPHDWHGPFKNLVRFIFWHRNCNNYET